MNTAPFSTSLWARVKRGLIVLASMAAAASLVSAAAWLTSDDFSAIVDGNKTALAIAALLTTPLTQLAGHLAGKR